VFENYLSNFIGLNVFRLIVVAEKDLVYKRFPIPLISRLEKHFFTTSALLDDGLKQLHEKLTNWVKEFVRYKTGAIEDISSDSDL
jgi:hypothetical protein